MNSDITMTDTQRAINQTKGREEMGRVSRIKKPRAKNIGYGENNGWSKSEQVGYNRAYNVCEAFRKQELNDLADIHRIKMRFLIRWNMGQIKALEIAKEVARMIKEKL